MKYWRLKLDCACVIALALTATIALCSCKTSEASETEPLEVAFQPTRTATTEETIVHKQVPIVVETPATEVTEATEPPYAEEELEYMALVIYQEAGSDYCSDETRLAVGTVVMNRVGDPRFPDTIYDVLMQKSQYGSFYWTGLVWPDKASSQAEAHAVERAYECAKKILEGYRSFGDDVIWQAEFVQGSEIVSYQDGIYFCR